MAYQEEFVASPETFMRNNVVTPQFRDGGFSIAESRPIVITIKEWVGKRCSKAGGKCYYFSVNVDGLSRLQKLPIYWLAYKEDSFTQGVLNNQSRYMFTALMNGCSLGFGSQSGGGCCQISHANMKSSGGGDAQATAQYQQLQGRFQNSGSGFNVIEPSAYQKDKYGGKGWQATNFGKNVNGTWEFYTHKFQCCLGNSSIILHGGVEQAISVPGIIG
jgi:hypothetical protein